MHRHSKPVIEHSMKQVYALADSRWASMHQSSTFERRKKTMKTYLHRVMLMTVAIALSSSSLAMADYRDHNDKAWNSLYKAQSARQSMSHSYRTNSPMVAQTESAPTEVAQTPAKERTYSYDPSQQSDSSTGCAKKSDSSQPSQVAEQPAQTQRSFSYEPSSNGPTVRRSYSVGHQELSLDVGRHAKGY
jgi:hypothetical protein